MSNLHSINQAQQLYVLSEGKGYSCLGFEYAYNRAKAVAEWANAFGYVITQPNAQLKGTPEGYQEYLSIMTLGSQASKELGRRCGTELTPQLIGKEGLRVEVIRDNGIKARFYVGKSTGWMPCHLEIAQRDSSGGTAVYGAPFQSVRVVGTK